MQTFRYSWLGAVISAAAFTQLAHIAPVNAQLRPVALAVPTVTEPVDIAPVINPIPAIEVLPLPDAVTPPPGGGFDLNLESDKPHVVRFARRADLAFDFARVRPLYQAREASHVANGVALRNRTQGVIQTRGVPRGSLVVNSFLFWNLSDTRTVGTSTMAALINGNLVQGRKTADNTEPCWGNVGNHSYVANVTQFTNQSGGPNQDYEITLPFTGTTSTSGQNPWSPIEASDVRLEGATLVVVYRNATTVGPLAIFAPPGDNMFFANAAYTFPNPGVGAGLFTAFGADGQRGGGHSTFLSGETTAFSNTGALAGPGTVSGSDWDGDDGLTLPQLWDTHTHQVKLAGATSSVKYTSPGDCIVPVGFVLDQE
jgi:hypothetical protein